MPRSVVLSRKSPGVDTGLYESLLTERLNAALVERRMKTAGNAETRAQLFRDLLQVIGDEGGLQAAEYQEDPAKIRRLDAVIPTSLGARALSWPVTPLSNAGLTTNARDE